MAETEEKMDKVTYLEKYLDICERFVSGQIPRGTAVGELGALNIQAVGGPEWMKQDVIGSNLVTSRDDWVPSMVC